jgi:hypothetical protein
MINRARGYRNEGHRASTTGKHAMPTDVLFFTSSAPEPGACSPPKSALAILARNRSARGGYTNTNTGNTLRLVGGLNNTVSGTYAAIGGGYNNVASGIQAAVGGTLT